MNNVDKAIDLIGMRCPLVAIKVQYHMRMLAKDQILQVVSDDPLSEIDVTYLCKEHNYILVDINKDAEKGNISFTIQKI